MTLKKSLLISLFIHIIIFSLGMTNIFLKPQFTQWHISPVELINIVTEEVKKELPKVIKKEEIKKQKLKEEKLPLHTEKIFKRIEKAAKPLTDNVKELPQKTAFTPKSLSSPVLIEVERFPFNYYLEIIRNKITQNWHPQKGSGKAEVGIFFKILRDGKVKDISMKNSSGVAFIDRAAERAIVQSDPFPPLPLGFGEDYLGVHITFRIEEFEF